MRDAERSLKWGGEKLRYQWTDLYERCSIKKYSLPKQQSYNFLRCRHLLEDAVCAAGGAQTCRFIELEEANTELGHLRTVPQDQRERSSGDSLS